MNNYAKITVEYPDGQIKTYTGKIVTVLVSDNGYCKGDTVGECTGIEMLNHAKGLRKVIDDIAVKLSENIAEILCEEETI